MILNFNLNLNFFFIILKETRVLFKDIVNQVAFVSTEGNQKYLSLRNSSNSIDEPPKLPPRTASSSDQLNCHDSRSNLNYQATGRRIQNEIFFYLNSINANYFIKLHTAHPYYDAQNKISNQLQFNQQQRGNFINQSLPKQFSMQQASYQQRHYPSSSNVDPSINHQVNNQSKSYQNQFQISDVQPRQPFSYNLNQPVPAFLNQRIHSAEMNNLDMNLIQPKPVPTIPQMPINLMNPNLLISNSRYSSRNVEQQPPLPAKNNNPQWCTNNLDCPPKAPPRRKSFASGTNNTYLNNKKGSTNLVKVR